MVDYFGVQFGEGGLWWWWIDLNNPFAIPSDGFVQMTADNSYGTSTGYWILNTDDPTVGSTSDEHPGITDEDWNYLNHKFMLNPGGMPDWGACCHSDGSCTVETENDCDYVGGEYKGDDTDCGPPSPCTGRLLLRGWRLYRGVRGGVL